MAESTSTSSGSAGGRASPSTSSSALPSELSRSSSTPPELDGLSSTNVFAFGLHSSYAAFANSDGAAAAPQSTPSTAAQPSPPPSSASSRSSTTTSNGGSGLIAAATHLSVAHHQQHQRPHLLPMPGMEQPPPSATSPPSSYDIQKGSGVPHSWHPSQASLNFSHLSLPPSSSPLLHLSPPNLHSPFPSTFLFSPPPPSSTSSSPSQAPSPHSNHPSDPSSSDPSLSSLPLDYHPYYYMPSLPPMPLSSSGFDPFALPLPMYLSNAPNPTRPGLNSSICKFYAAGHCARGDQCNYAHVRADGTTLHPGQMRGGGGGGGMVGGMRGGRGRGDMRGGERGRGRGGMRGGGYRGQRMVDEQPSASPHHFHSQHFLSPHSLHKDGGMQPHPGQMAGGSNPLSPLSPALLPMHPLTDPSLLLHSPPFAPLDYPVFSPWPPAGDFFDSANPLGLGFSASPEELMGRVYQLAKDQNGCRLLQRLLDEQRVGVVDVVYEETFPHLNELMTDPFGNYLCQKLIEHCSEQQRLSILSKVASDVVSISLNLHGTRAVQKLVESISSPRETELLVSAIRSAVVSLVKDLNGNHVIQRCLHHLSSVDNQVIYDAVCRHCVSVSTHKHGCCVLQRCIDYATVGQKRQLIHEICVNALELVQDAYGNYVVQYVLDLNDPASTAAIVTNLAGHIGSLSVQKFSSNVIEKCIAADTLIATADGLSQRIEDMQEGATVMCRQAQGLAVGEVSRVLRRGRKRVVIVEMEDGRSLQCTADHLLRTREGWRTTEEIEVERTQVVVGVEGVEDRRDHLEAAFTIDLPHLRLSMKEERRRCLALMRVVGFRCGQSGSASHPDGLLVQHIHDRLCLVHDLELITDDDDCAFTLTADGCWAVAMPSLLSMTTILHCLHALHRTDCPAALRREFVAGCFGACGSIDMDSMRAALRLHQSTEPLSLALATLLPLLLQDAHQSDPPSSSTPPPFSSATIPLSDLLSFAACTGSRFNIQLSSLLSVSASFLRARGRRFSPLSSLSFSCYCKRLGCANWLQPSSAAFCCSSIPTFSLRVSSIVPAGDADVFDLTVDHSHSFVAAGVVVHNCLELSNDKLRARMVEELVNPERLPRLLQDPYANYVLQKALSVSKKQQLERLVTMIRPHLHQLKNTAFGKRIQNKILKKFPDLDMERFDPVQGLEGSASLPLQQPTATSFGVPLLPNVAQGPGLTGASAVSTLGGGAYEASVSYPGSSGSPPPLLSPTSRHLSAAIGPVGSSSVSPVNAADLGLNALNESLASLALSSSQGSASGSSAIGGSGGSGAGAVAGAIPFYSAFSPDSNGVVSVGAAQSSLFSP